MSPASGREEPRQKVLIDNAIELCNFVLEKSRINQLLYQAFQSPPATRRKEPRQKVLIDNVGPRPEPARAGSGAHA